jgi:predicted MFS family arabinose efflux permease
MVLAVLAALLAAWSVRALPQEPGRDAVSQPSEAGSWAAPVRDTLSSRGPWLLALTFAAYSSQWLTVIGFLPTLYADAGIAASTAGLLTAGVALANVLGNVASGRLLQRGVPRLMLLWMGFATMACGAFVAFGLEAQTSPGMRYVAVWLFSAVGGLIPGTLFATAVHVAPNERALPTVMGWLIQWSALGQFMGPPLAAWWTSHHGGWSTTWVTTGSAAVLGALLSLGVARVRR